MDEVKTAVTGKCLCGKVTYQASVKPGSGACHCGMCRRWSGGPYMAIHAHDKPQFDGNEHIKHFASSEWAERGFCSNCGSSLYYHLLPRPGAPDGEYMMATGTIDQQESMVFEHEVYVDANPGWYSFTGESDRKRMTEADLLALYAPDNEE